MVRWLMLFALVLSLSGCGESMSFGSKKPVYLFSSVKGQLTYQGKIAESVMVRRWLEYNGESYEDRVETNEAGYFVFDAISKDERRVLPKEFLSHQKMFVTYRDKEILIWETMKRSEEENAELEGEPLSFTCELTDETRFVHLSLNSIGTKCRW